MTSLSLSTRNATLRTRNWYFSTDSRAVVEALLDMGHCVILRVSEIDNCVYDIAASVESISLAYDVATNYCLSSFVIFPNGLGMAGASAKDLGRKDFTSIAMINLDGAA
jgi:hypothetical protein